MWLTLAVVVVFAAVCAFWAYLAWRAFSSIQDLPRRIDDLARRQATQMFWAFEEGMERGTRYYVPKQPSNQVPHEDPREAV